MRFLVKESIKIRGLKDQLTRGLQIISGIPNLIPLCGADGEYRTEPTGVLEWGSSITDRMGTRSILRRYDYVLPWALCVRIRYADVGLITDAVWSALWDMGANMQGLGAARPRGYGKFQVVENEKE